MRPHRARPRICVNSRRTAATSTSSLSVQQCLIFNAAQKSPQYRLSRRCPPQQICDATNVHASIARPSTAGTRNPKPIREPTKLRLVKYQIYGDRRRVGNCAQLFAQRCICRRKKPPATHAGEATITASYVSSAPSALNAPTVAHVFQRTHRSRFSQPASDSVCASSASTSCCRPPFKVVKIERGPGRFSAPCVVAGAPFALNIAAIFARICRCAASMPRVREPYWLSISTSFGSTVRALSCVASPP